MTQLTENLSKRKGFTLVEVIIVLVILAILAAILIPSLTGYIDKANEKTSVANCRSFVMAAQTILSETYGEDSSKLKSISSSTAPGKTVDASSYDLIQKMFKLSELDQSKFKADIEASANGKISKVEFDDGKYKVTFDNSKYVAKTSTGSVADAASSLKIK